MSWIEISSGNIARLGYEPFEKTVVVEYRNGKRTEFLGVERHEYTNLAMSDDIQKHLDLNFTKFEKKIFI